LELTNGITANFQSDIGPVNISAGGLRWDGAAKMASVMGSIHAEIKNLGTATCQTMALDINNKAVIFGAVQIIVLSGAIISQNAVANTSNQSTDSQEKIVFNAPQGGRDDEQRKMLHISGPVTVTQGDVKLTTVGIDFDHVTRDAKALAPVVITDDANQLKGDNGDVNFKTHIATVNGHVDIYAVPKDQSTKSSDDLDTEARQPTHMHCDHLVYNYRTKLADADGHLVVLQTSRTVTATTAHYDTVAQVITLHGNVDAKSNDGKHFTAPDATVSVKQDDEWIEIKGPVTYEFTPSDEDNPLPPDARKSSKKSGAKPKAPQVPTPSASPTPTPNLNTTP
jgi:lipopolysaccharide assembly outer membrane protein LptD (OstA)